MIDRRQFLQLGGGIIALPTLKLYASESSLAQRLIQRPIPSSGEQLPVIGMGTSISFDTDGSATSLAQLTEVMRVGVGGGGSVIDSSPM